MAQRHRLGEIMLSSGILTWDQLEEGLKAQMVYGGRLGTCLVELGLVSEDELSRVLSEQLHLPVASREQLEVIPPKVLELLTPQQAERLHAIPFRQEGRRADVAMVDPSPDVVDEVQFTTSMTIRPHVAPEVYLTYMLERHYGIPRPARYIRLVDDDPLFRKGHAASAPPGRAAAEPPVGAPAPRAAGAGASPPPPGGAGPVESPTDETSLAACVRHLLSAGSEKDIIAAAVGFAGGYFERMAVLVGSEDLFRPVRADHVDSEGLKKLQIRRNEPFLEAVLAGGSVQAGPLPAPLQDLAVAMGEGPDSSLYLAPLFSTRWKGLLVGAGLKRAMGEADERLFTLLHEKVTMALDILILRRRLESLPGDLR